MNDLLFLLNIIRLGCTAGNANGSVLPLSTSESLRSIECSSLSINNHYHHQNIFGVLFFIRLSWIIGTAGILQGLLVVITCASVVSHYDIDWWDDIVNTMKWHCHDNDALSRLFSLPFHFLPLQQMELSQEEGHTIWYQEILVLNWVSLMGYLMGPREITGGAVGILFYLGTTIAASMYITGAVEIFLVSNPFCLFPFPSFLSSSSHSFSSTH